MKYSNNVLNISLQQIQIFLKCVHLKNYSRVAAEYNFTPSMVSKTISSMESTLGLQLFIRKYHTLIPTPAAKELASDWTPLLEMILQSLEKAHTIQEGYASNIRIGLLDTTRTAASYTVSKLEEKASRDLLEKIVWERRDMHELTGMIEDNYFDLIITWLQESSYFDNKNIFWKEIFHSNNAVFIHKSHPLFYEEIHSFSAFKQYPFLTLSPAVYPHYYHLLENVCKAHGFTPLISTSVSNTNSVHYNLTLGKGQLLADGLICDWESSDIRKVELEGLGDSGLIVAWNPDNKNPLTDKIIQLLTN
ncbi:hypothetical protein PMF13cell1_05303 [Blautia producta]|uniref:HTH lysR-type domain-containing protein n=1 Tax=Blautia producta TaxID=33035 RepID=A0A4P6M830_9FIRM|nr:LysR family transcriptional regulator [Blautia producta]QBE99717.1 hypothetical protein PMF13cell1_05303 [Blautia producta]